jgi:hypothetical protein
MQGITAKKVPDKYEPKNTDESGTFDRAMTKLLAVPADEVQRKIQKHKSAGRNLKTSESGPPLAFWRRRDKCQPLGRVVA